MVMSCDTSYDMLYIYVYSLNIYIAFTILQLIEYSSKELLPCGDDIDWLEDFKGYAS